MLASLVVAWSIAQMGPGLFPRHGRAELDEPETVLLGGTQTQLLSDDHLWSLLRRGGRPSERFADRLDYACDFAFRRTHALAEAIIELQNQLAAAGPNACAP